MTNYERYVVRARVISLSSRASGRRSCSPALLYISLLSGRERVGSTLFLSPCPIPSSSSSSSSSSSGSPSISEHRRWVLWGEWPLPAAAPAGSCPFSPQFRAYPANSSGGGGGGIISLRQWTGAAGGAWASRARVPRPRQRAGHQSRARTRTKAGSLNGLTTSKVTSADGSCSATVCCPITGK